MNTTPVEAPAQPTFFGEREEYVTWKNRANEIVEKYKKADGDLEASQWEIAYWILDGEKDFGKDAYAEAARIFHFLPGSLYNMVWVARKFSREPEQISLRNETWLKWSHFTMLARLPDDQERDVMFAKLRTGTELSVSQVCEMVIRRRDEIDRASDIRNHRKPSTKGTLHVSLTTDEKRQFKRHAKAQIKTSNELLQIVVRDWLDKHKDDLPAKKSKSTKRRVSPRNGDAS